MSDLKPPNSLKSQSNRGYSPEEELTFLRTRVAELERQTQELYQQAFLLQQRISTSDLNEKERAEFISHVAHELRTPLTSIKGYVDLVLEGETGSINELQREFLGVVGLNAEKLSRIIGDLLDVSRLEAGQFGFKPVMMDLRELVLQTCAEVRPQLEAVKVIFEVVSKGNSQLPASLDPERFSQAIRAILAHAGQISPEGGVVRMTIDSDETGYAIIRVEDEGSGIPQADIDRVFTKFWRPSNQTWRQGGGPGMGLAIAKTIIDIHEGQVWAENRPAGQTGTVFTIKIPLISRPLNNLDLYSDTLEGDTPLYAALVITQNEEFGRVVHQTLGKGGFQIIVANDRSELVSETPSWQPDLIINNGAEADLLNEEDGTKLAPALRGAAILTLNLSAVEQRLIGAGAQAVLPWPASEQILLDCLQQTIVPARATANLEEFKQLQTILLVSPSSEVLRGMERIIREAGFSRIYRAMRESDALTLARRYPPNWLLLDIPDETQEQESLFDMLREDQLLRKTPTIVFLRPEQIAPAPSPDYRPSFIKSGQRRLTTDELKRLRSTGELRPRRGTGELRNRPGTGELASRPVGTDELKGPYYNIVPKPFLQKRFINVAQRLVGKR